jgi:uncharacterized membrane protein
MYREIAWTTLAVAACLFPLDFIWLKLMRPYYESQMGNMLLDQPRMAATVAFYCLYAVGVAFFAVIPNLQGGTLLSTVLYGALLGAVAYGTYDATNYATLRNFPLSIMAVDWAWGIFLTAVSAAGGWAIRSWLT